MFGAVKLTKSVVQSKFIYIGYGIAFAGPGSWSFWNIFAQNIDIFALDNNLSIKHESRETFFNIR